MLGSLSVAQEIQPLDWQSGPGLPETRAEGVAVLAPDDSTLLLGGISAVNGQVVPKLIPGGTSWTTAPQLDTARISPGAVRYAGNRILVFGGTGGGEASNEVLDYDYRFGDSQDVAKMTVARRQFAFAADSFGNPYAIGGMDKNDNVLFDTEYYDPDLGRWIQIIDPPEARYAASSIGDNNGNVFLFGGVSVAGDIVDSVFCYSTTEDSWVILAPMPVAVKNSAAVFINGHIYVISGISAEGPVATVQIYDLATGVWALDTDLPEGRSSHAAVIDSLGRIIVIGGYDADGMATATVFQSQRLNVAEVLPVIASAPIENASLDAFYTYDVDATGNPDPTFSLVQAPDGMSIDDVTGLISWQPVDGQVGNHDVTVTASNRVGADEQTFTITVVADTTAPTAPSNLTADAIGETYVNLSWTAATDNIDVDHYALFKTKRCGFRGIKTCYVPIDLQQNIPLTHTKVTGLLPLSAANYVVRAVDAARNQSPFSNKVSVQTLSSPINFQYRFKGTAGLSVILPANSPLELQLFSMANPKASYSLVSGPQGLVVDPATGLVQWTPSSADIGLQTVVFQAANSVGSATLNVDINVSSDVPQLSVQFNPSSGGARYAVAGVQFTAQVIDASNTPATYALITAPSGMSIDASSGLISWLPAPDQAGVTNVTVRAVNAGGTTDLSFDFYTHFTGPVSNIQVSNLTALHPLATWNAPVGVGADLVQGYAVVATARYRRGRAWRTDQVTYDVPGGAIQIELTGLTAGRDYKLSINAYDAAGNRGLVNPTPISVIPRPALPNIGWKISNGAGGDEIVAEQPMVIQLTDHNAAPSTFSIVDAPAGLTLDPATGLARWTPSAADVGSVRIRLRATNSVGPSDVSITVNVLFSGPVQNAAAFRVNGTTSASVRWLPPADNALPVVGYQVIMHWRWGSRNRSRKMTTSATSIEFSLIPTGAVWHRGVTIAPIDAKGRLGAPTPLIPYGSIAAPPPTNAAPVANAGSDQTIVLPHTAVTLNGSATDDGLPSPGQLTYLWSVVPGSGSVAFGDPNAASTTASFPGDGVYVLRLSVSDGERSAHDDVVITVNPAPQSGNRAPVVDAGLDQTITLPADTVTLDGSASDDGLPSNPGVMTVGWSVVSGPGVVTFGDAGAASTSASFSVDGTYTLKLAASDGLLSAEDFVQVTVNPDPSLSGPPPYDRKAPKANLKGLIQEIGIDFIVVDGIKVWYTDSTRIRYKKTTGKFFELGQSAVVRGSQNNDGSVSAKKIKVWN